MEIPAQVRIAISLLHGKATGDTIADRFKSLITPDVLEAACFMTTDEDHQFRAAVGALMLSYELGSPEWQAIEHEMHMIQQCGAILTAAEAGLAIDVDSLTMPTRPPIGLIHLWRERTKRP